MRLLCVADQVTNPQASGSLSWAFNKGLLLDTGFSITPEKVTHFTQSHSTHLTPHFPQSLPISCSLSYISLPAPEPSPYDCLIPMLDMTTFSGLETPTQNLNTMSVWR